MAEPERAGVDTSVPRDWTGRLAYVVSQIGSPPVLAPVAVSLTAWSLAEPRAWTWAGIYVLLAVVLPLLHLAWLVRRGVVTDMDVQRREQRARPLFFTVACGGLAFFVLVLGRAHPYMAAVAGALWLQTAVILVITLRWKISMHGAAAGGVATLALLLAGTPLPLLIGVPLIGWSRVWLRRHTVAQVVAGALLGCMVFLSALSLAVGR